MEETLKNPEFQVETAKEIPQGEALSRIVADIKIEARKNPAEYLESAEVKGGGE